MQSTHLKTAIEEAQRFIIRAEDLITATAQCRSTEVLPFAFHDRPKEQGAVKRASMDLTRALAELRK